MRERMLEQEGGLRTLNLGIWVSFCKFGVG